MTPDRIEFRREYLVKLPLPLAQLYGRAFNAKSPRERHDNAFYLFEAMIKLAASIATAVYLDEISKNRMARVPQLDRLLAQLALPSLGQWLGIMRELARHFGKGVDADTHPWGQAAELLHRKRKDLPAMLALFQRIKHGPDGAVAGDQSCSFLDLFDALVQYRNGVFGHGAGRFESFYADEMGPLLFPALNEVVDPRHLTWMGPAGGRLVYLSDLRILEDGSSEVGLRELTGTQGERLPAIKLDPLSATGLRPNRVAYIWPGRLVPLRLDPLLQYRESEFSEEVLFLNRDRNGKQVEYLSYTTGRTERDRAMLPALAEFLSQVSDRQVSEEDLERLREQTRSETSSIETLFEIPATATQSLGEYELLAEIGRGGMGVVYLARQQSLGRLVALKMLPRDLSTDDTALARFRREIRHLARCDDPHIVKVLSSGTFPDGRLYYTMEYVPGSDLEMVWRELSGSHSLASQPTSSALLGNSTWAEAVLSASRKQRGRTEVSTSERAYATDLDLPPADASQALPLPPLPNLPEITEAPGGFIRKVVLLARDVALALQSIHDQGIVHRDVKPANLVLTPDGSRVVLMDFGLANAETTTLSISRHGGLLGTLRYAAPEQLAAANIKVGPAADVRGLGVTVWELLTRRRAFGNAQDETQLVQEVLTADVPRLRSIDPKFDRDLDAIIARATERRLSDRIPSAGLFAEYLQLWLDGKPLPIRPPGTVELAIRWCREHALWATAASCAVLVGIILSGTYFRDVARRTEASRETIQNLRQQSQYLRGGVIPAIIADLGRLDVDIAKVRAVLPSIESQAEVIDKMAHQGTLWGGDVQEGHALSDHLKELLRDLVLTIDLTERLTQTRLMRFDLTDDSFQQADGLPIPFGRSGIPIYKHDFSTLAEVEILDETNSPEGICTRLKSHNIQAHIQAGLEDWFTISYRPDELPARSRLAKLLQGLDEGSQAGLRKSVRQEMIQRNGDALESLAQQFLQQRQFAGDSDDEQLRSGLLLSDGLLENLRVGRALDVLRKCRQLQSEATSQQSRYSRIAIYFSLGNLLNLVGSRDEVYEAIQSFEAAKALAPQLDAISLHQAISYLRLGRFEDADNLLESIRSPAIETLTRIMQGMSLASSGQGWEARRLIRELLTDKPMSLLAYHGAAEIFGELGDSDASSQSAAQGLKLDPESPQLARFVLPGDNAQPAAAEIKLSAERTRHWWAGAKLSAESTMLAGIVADDVEKVNSAVEELRRLGVRDWNLAQLEYRALFSASDWNFGSWEKPLRELQEQAPDILADSLPSRMLGALMGQKDALDNPQVQILLLREAESAPAFHPLARFWRLESSGRLVMQRQPEVAALFYEAAIRAMPKAQGQGYGNDRFWNSRKEQLKELIHSIRDPQGSNDPASASLGTENAAQNLARLGRAKLISERPAEGEAYFQKSLEAAEQAMARDPANVNPQIDLALALYWLAYAYDLQGKLDKAHELAQRHLEFTAEMRSRFPQDARVAEKQAAGFKILGEIEKRQGHLNKAVEYNQQGLAMYKTLLAKEPRNGALQDHVFFCLNELGNLMLDQEQFEAARNYFLESLPHAEERAKYTPNNYSLQHNLAIVHSNLGRVYLRLREVKLANAAFEAFLRVSENLASVLHDDPRAIVLLGEAYAWLVQVKTLTNEAQAAREYADKEIAVRRRSLEIAPQDQAARNALAQALASRAVHHRYVQDHAAAIADFDEAIAIAPGIADIWNLRGHVYYDLSNADKAIADYTQAIAIQPQNDESYRNRGRVFIWKEQFAEAESDFTKAIELAPNNVANWDARGQLHATRGDWKKAQADFEQLLQIEPDHPDALNQLAIAQFRNGDLASTIKSLQAGVQSNATHPGLRRNLAAMYGELGDWEAAQKEYDFAIDNKLDFSLVAAEAALVAWARNDLTKYQQILNDVMKLFEDSSAGSDVDPDSLAWTLVRFAWQPAESTRWKEVLKAIAESPDERISNRTRAAACYRLEEWGKGESLLKANTTEETSAGQPQVLYLLAMLQARQGNIASAKDWIRRGDDAVKSASGSETEPARLRWIQRIEVEELRHECEELVR